MAREDSLLSSQSTFPSRSYERSLFLPIVMISMRPPLSQTKGVDQVVGSSRSTRQISFPVAFSSANR